MRHLTKCQNVWFWNFCANLSCQYFHSNSLTCCYTLASTLHESLNWVLLFLLAAPETGNMIWRTGNREDDKTSQQWHLWLICQRLCQQWKAWLPHAHQSTLIHVKRCYPHASTRNKRHETGPYLCEPLLLLYTKRGWRAMQSGCQLNSQVGCTYKWQDRGWRIKTHRFRKCKHLSAALSYLLLLQTLQLLEMVMWKD